jgi:hypothetical protein
MARAHSLASTIGDVTTTVDALRNKPTDRVRPVPRTKRPARILSGGALAAIATLALTACGSSTPSPTPTAATVSPTTYVTSMCSAVAQLSRDGVIEARRFSAGANGVRTLAHDKSVAQAYVSAFARDARQTVTRMRTAGTPNVQNGNATAAAFLSSYVRLEATLAATAKKARSIPTSSDRAFKRAPTPSARASDPRCRASTRASRS